MKRKWKIGLAVLCAVALATVAYAASAGGQQDPLITLSYLRDIFTGQVQTMVDDTVAAGQQQVTDELNEAIQEWDARVSEAVANAAANPGQEGAVFTLVTLTRGQTLTAQPGCEIILRTGGAVSGGALIDSTAGTSLASGGALAANHLYLSAEGCTLTIPAQQTTGTVTTGPLNVRSGPGSSYSVQGTLATGATVVITDTATQGWYGVTSGSLSGYVSSTYVQLNAATGSDTVTLLIRGAHTVQ